MALGRAIEILLVEDNWADAVLTREALADARVNNNLSIVTGGDEAIRFLNREDEFAKAKTPDLVLLDLNLPGMRGHEVLKWIKGHEEHRRIPVIVLTASHDPDDVRTVYEANANCYLVKPIDMSEFLNIIRSLDQFWLSVVRLPSE